MQKIVRRLIRALVCSISILLLLYKQYGTGMFDDRLIMKLRKTSFRHNLVKVNQERFVYEKSLYAWKRQHLCNQSFSQSLVNCLDPQSKKAFGSREFCDEKKKLVYATAVFTFSLILRAECVRWRYKYSPH